MPVRRFAPAALLVLAVAAAMVSVMRPVPARAEPPVWHDDFKAALQAARDQDKPVFLVFRCVP